MRCNVSQGRVEVRGIVPVDKIGVPGTGVMERREPARVSDSVFHRLVVRLDVSVVVAAPRA